MNARPAFPRPDPADGEGRQWIGIGLAIDPLRSGASGDSGPDFPINSQNRFHEALNRKSEPLAPLAPLSADVEDFT